MSTDKNILLILDLDETLIHATRTKLDVQHDFEFADYFVYLRPHLDWFLNQINADFRLAVWSSADDNYVENIVNRIRPSDVNFEFVWGRSRCTTTRNYDLDEYVFEKRLKKIKKQGYSLEQSLIVDDSPEKTRNNYGNAIYVKPFNGQPEDLELKNLALFLDSLKNSDNVRNVEKRHWRNQ